MNNLMLLLFLFFLVCLPIGLIKPSLVIRWGEMEKRNRKNVLKYYGIGCIVAFILFGATLPKTENTEDKSTTAKVQSTVKEQPKEKTEEEKVAEEAKAKADAETKAKADEEAKKAKEEADAKAAAEAIAAAAKKAEEEKVAYDTGITYNQLARTPDDYKGKKAKFTGKVVQVMEGDKETDLRIAVDGNYDTILFVGYDPKITSIRILENDNVTVKGKSLGIYSYQSTMGGKISVPSVWGDNIVINNK